MKMLIDGKWVDSYDKKIMKIFNPYTGELIDIVPNATEKDVDIAIESAKKGKKIMAHMSAYKRNELLEKLSDKIA